MSANASAVVNVVCAASAAVNAANQVPSTSNNTTAETLPLPEVTNDINMSSFTKNLTTLQSDQNLPMS